MKKIVIFICVLICCAFIDIDDLSSKKEERLAVQKLVESTYVQVLYNGNKDLELLRRGFHEDFNMYVYYQEKLSKRTREEWIDKLIEVRKRPKKATNKKRDYSWKFKRISVEGQTAMVVLEIKENKQLKYTDFLTLYKMENGWQVMTKLFSMH